MNKPPKPGKKIVFEALPRTGSLSLVDSLYRHYGKKNIYSIKKNEQNLIPSDAIIAHGHRAGYWLKKPEDYVYFTLLRKPESQVISVFNSLSRQLKRKHFWRIRLQHKGIGYYMNQLKFKMFDNLMVRRISGNYYTPFGCIGQSHLEQAIDAIKRKYFFIGFTDEFELSLLELKKLLGWRENQLPFYIRTNSEFKSLSIRKESYIQDFRDLNIYDYKLYDYCKELFLKDRTVNNNELEVYKTKLKQFQYENIRKPSLKTRAKMILMRFINPIFL